MARCLVASVLASVSSHLAWSRASLAWANTRIPASNNIVTDVVPKSSCCMTVRVAQDTRRRESRVFGELPISSSGDSLFHPGGTPKFFLRCAHRLTAPAHGCSVRNETPAGLDWVRPEGQREARRVLQTPRRC